VLNEAGGRIVFRFHARDVHLVLRSRAGTAVPFRVAVDGAGPRATRTGSTWTKRGTGTLVQPRLYQLVREPGEITDRTFEMTFLDARVEAYVFTFGLRRARTPLSRSRPVNRRARSWPTDRPSFRATAQNIPSVRGSE
jgi:hypothetical protein